MDSDSLLTQVISSWNTWNPKMKAASSSETLVSPYQSTRRHISEDSHLHQSPCENF